MVAVVGLAWAGRMAYRRYKNIVSIDVYNTPLSEVVRSLARQTGEMIIPPNGLDPKVTFTAKNLPLDTALDQMGRKNGFNWSRWHAVHGSGRALNQLETALRNRAKLDTAGWTNLAPQETMDGPMLGGGGQALVTRGKPVQIRLGPGDVKNGDVAAAVRDQMKAAGVDPAMMQGSAMMREITADVDEKAGPEGGSKGMRHGTPQIRMVTRTRDANGEMHEEIWSPEHVVLDEKLESKLGEPPAAEASEEMAKQVAQKVKGRLTTLYVLSRGPGNLPFGGNVMRRFQGKPGDGTNGVAGGPPPMPDIESVVRRAEAEKFTQLTPEQRVQRAREKKAVIIKP